MKRFLLPLFFIVLAHPLTNLSAFQSQPNDKLPVPAEADQKQASQLVGSLFKKEYDAAQTPQQRSELAKKMLQVGIDSQGDDPLSGYVLLRIAKEVAAGAGDVDTALSATEKLSEHFEVDGLALKTEILEKVAKALRIPKDHQGLAAHFQAALDEAVAQDRFDIAKSINAAALVSARQARSVDLVKQAAVSVRETEELEAEFQKCRAAFATLETSPTAPEANLLVGQYQCFIKGDWEQGVLKLALGNDEPIKRLALLELESPDPIKLGDGWWEISEGRQGRMAANIQKHAVEWYSRATDLKGLTKIKVDQRIAEFSANGQIARKGNGVSRRQLATGNIHNLVKQAVTQNAFDETSYAGGSSPGADFRDILSEGGVLAGVRVTTGVFGTMNYKAVASIQPIYHTEAGEKRGAMHGPALGNPTELIAKEGYAVGAIRLKLQPHPRVLGLQIIFMRISGNRLDPKDSYASEPYLDIMDDVVVLGGNGQPIIGVKGSVIKQEMRGLGVIQPR